MSSSNHSRLWSEFRKASHVMGMAQVMGGSLALAEVFSPDANAVMVLGAENPELYTTAHVCMDCAMEHPLLFLQEKICARAEVTA